MKLWLLVVAAAVSASAHMVSISTGEVRVDGSRVHYELLMPRFELTHMANPERTLLRQVRFRSGATDGRLLSSSCQVRDNTLVCEADYGFPNVIDSLTVECTLAAVTVANHVHVLHARKGALTDQAVLDLSYPSAQIRFRPPTALETELEAAGAGIRRSMQGAAPLLFLFAVALAARSRKELLALMTSLLVAETAATFGSRYLPWILSPRFLEASAALTVAWLAVEILWLPDAPRRWAVVFVLGIFHGMYFSAFLVESSYPAAPFLAGVGMSEVITAGIFTSILFALRRFKKAAIVMKTASAALLLLSLGWFGAGLIG